MLMLGRCRKIVYNCLRLFVVFVMMVFFWFMGTGNFYSWKTWEINASNTHLGPWFIHWCSFFTKQHVSSLSSPAYPGQTAADVTSKLEKPHPWQAALFHAGALKCQSPAASCCRDWWVFSFFGANLVWSRSNIGDRGDGNWGTHRKDKSTRLLAWGLLKFTFVFSSPMPGYAWQQEWGPPSKVL